MTARMASDTGAAKERPVRSSLPFTMTLGDRYAKRFRLRRGAPERIDPHGGGDIPHPCHDLISPPGRCPPMVGLPDSLWSFSGSSVSRPTAILSHDAQSFRIWRLACRSTSRPIGEQTG